MTGPLGITDRAIQYNVSLIQFISLTIFQFYSTALPDPPRQLTLHGKCTDLTANLTWVIGHRNAYEPLTRILIQWRASRDTSTWYNFSDHAAGSADGHVVKGLNPYSDIVFRVIAANQHGMGKPSNVTTGQECKTPAASKYRQRTE